MPPHYCLYLQHGPRTSDRNPNSSSNCVHGHSYNNRAVRKHSFTNYLHIFMKKCPNSPNQIEHHFESSWKNLPKHCMCAYVHTHTHTRACNLSNQTQTGYHLRHVSTYKMIQLIIKICQELVSAQPQFNSCQIRKSFVKLQWCIGAWKREQKIHTL